MGFWSNLFNRPNHAGETTNTNIPPPAPGTVGPTGWTPGDPDGVELVGFDEPSEHRALPRLSPSPWSGWPAEWSVPQWDFGSRFNELVDVAWNCLDLNASVLSSMPVYRTRGGQIVEPSTWMMNPDPQIYSSWPEFCKQLFWDFQLGEAFVLAMSFFSDGFPMRFRVVPPWLVHVELRNGSREYRLGGPGGTDVTNEILHIRYRSTVDKPRGMGPLESAGARMLTAGVLAQYIREVVSTGGVPTHTLETDQELTPDEAQDLANTWMSSRAMNLGAPPVLDNNVSLKTHMAMSPREMAMIEIAQFTEGRIANLLGVPQFLVGLPGGDDMTYSNVSQLFDFHDRASLRPKATHVMSALSNWALPRGQSAELNRDEYSRPALGERAEAYEKLVGIGALSSAEIRIMERFTSGDLSAEALTGGGVS